jgi:Dolichyl-phosphate-mannose-protein mannosyltransferase
VDPPGRSGRANLTGVATRWLAAAARTERWWASAAAVFVAAVTTYRLQATADAKYPGHADPAFYYNVAQNLHAGLGPKIDYIWEYLNGQPPLPRFAFDYWLPLPSYVMAAALGVHDDLSAALVLNVVWSVLLALGSYLLARQLSSSPWVPAATAVVVVVQPVVSTFAMQAEASIYLAGFALLALAAAVGARTRPRLWPVAGALAALGHLSRSEGLLLIIVLVLGAFAATPTPGLRGVRYAGLTLGGYVVVMSPFFVLSLRNQGTLLPPASTKFPFITDYENLYALHVDQSWSALLGGSGWDFVALRLSALRDQIAEVAHSGLAPISALVMVALVGACLVRVGSRRHAAGRRWWTEPIAAQWWWRGVSARWFVPVAWALTVFFFYAITAPVVSSKGAESKGLASIMPVLVVGAMAQLARMKWPAVVVGLIVAGLIVEPVLSLATTTRYTVAANNDVGRTAAQLIPQLQTESACLGRPVVLMTRQPWEITQATGTRTVMIPNAPLADILRVAARYAVTDIYFDDKRAAALTDAVLDAEAGTGPLAPSRSFDNGLVFRVRSQTGGTTC